MRHLLTPAPRNFGILLGFLFGFLAMYFFAVEINSDTSSSAEVLVFRRGHVPKYMQDMAKGKGNDEELGAGDEKAAETDKKDDEEADVNVIPAQKDVFTWREVDYDIEIKGEPRRLLDHVSGYVKPGTLTALMGTSGAGKTTLLDVSLGLASSRAFILTCSRSLLNVLQWVSSPATCSSTGLLLTPAFSERLATCNSKISISRRPRCVSRFDSPQCFDNPRA